MRFIPVNPDSTLREQRPLEPCDGRLSLAFDHWLTLCECRVKLCAFLLDYITKKHTFVQRGGSKDPGSSVYNLLVTKNPYLLFLLLTCLGSFNSCTDEGGINFMGDAQITSKSKENTASQVAVSQESVDKVAINLVSYQSFATNARSITMGSRSYSVESGIAVKVQAGHNSKNIRIYKLPSGNYTYELDLDGQIDFQIQPLSSDLKTANYLDGNGNLLGKGHITLSNNQAALHFERAHGIVMSNGWRDCFTGAAGSPEATIIVTAGSFIGPEFTLGFYTRIAIGCLF